MKLFPRQWFLPIICLAVLNQQAASDPLPQQFLITKGLEGTFNADWPGSEGRTYFMQFSFDLQTWVYAPFIDFGGEAHHRGIHSTAPKMFMRLHYIDAPGINSLEDAINADFDGDGLKNLFEVMNGYSPYKMDSDDNGIPDGAEDLDEDGTLTLFEQNSGRDPKVKDHPAVKLSVVVGN